MDRAYQMRGFNLKMVHFKAVAMPEQQFEDYKSKYFDLHEKVKQGNDKEKVSILEYVDFELELIHRDEINVTYILKLLANLKTANKSKNKSALYHFPFFTTFSSLFAPLLPCSISPYFEALLVAFSLDPHPSEMSLVYSLSACSVA